MIRRRGFLQSFVSIFLPIIGGPEQAPSTEPIVIPTPDGVGLSAENPQMIRDRTGTIFCASRADSSIASILWMVRDYVDRDHPGTITFLLNDPNNPNPVQYWALGELQVWPDGSGLWFTTEEVNNVDERRVTAMVSYHIKEYTV